MSKQPVKLTDEMTRAFVMHPDWPLMLQFIEEHFENSTDIQCIDTDKESTVVHAQVIASKKIDADLQSLKDTFTNLRNNYGKKKKGYE